MRQDTSSRLVAEIEEGKSVSASGGEMIPVKVVTAGSSYVNMLVGDRQVRARVDSRADISILSSEVYDRLKRKPGKVKEINMQLADKNSILKGFVTQPIHVQLGKQSSREGICVAPISDEMLLGHDLLCHFKALIDLHSDCLLVNGKSIPLNTTFRDKPVVARTVVPPNSVVRVPCTLEGRLGAHYMEPVNNLKVLMPKVIREANEVPVVCLVNPSD
ncbi:hypothetical protein DPMN_090547 [Dreissena polymorpha]|uniref:Uncharacterized protein n=1 Tax=Dreissena polymorpha TaxID=45954 RepID=A0A9D4QZ38_DREPO|nr:hypothetical protein DPMN_090547 [Dreissena polymorpha]